MQIETTKQVTSKVEVPVPSFWKSFTTGSIQEYTAIIDENTAVNLFVSDGYTTIQHGTPEEMKHKVESAFKTASLCTEQEFMEAYSKVLKSLSLQPELI